MTSDQSDGLIERAILIYGHPPGSPRLIASDETVVASYYGIRIDGTEETRD